MEETKVGNDGRMRVVKKPSSNYTFKIDINAINPITYLSIPNHSMVTRTEDKTPTRVEILQLEGNASLMKKDLLVYFRTKQMDKPVLLAQPHPAIEDEIACLISLVPTFVAPEP